MFAVFFFAAMASAASGPAELRIAKGARTLSVYSDGKLLKTYKIALGSAPVGPKRKQGDYRTPEGDYYVCQKNSASQFYLSLGLSYPNAADAAEGVKQGLITARQRGAIAAALKRGRCPPWGTALGGEIFIHGGGTGKDWTWGCIALENKDVKALFDSIPVGTKVAIEP